MLTVILAASLTVLLLSPAYRLGLLSLGFFLVTRTPVSAGCPGCCTRVDFEFGLKAGVGGLTRLPVQGAGHQDRVGLYDLLLGWNWGYSGLVRLLTPDKNTLFPIQKFQHFNKKYNSISF